MNDSNGSDGVEEGKVDGENEGACEIVGDSVGEAVTGLDDGAKLAEADVVVVVGSGWPTGF